MAKKLIYHLSRIVVSFVFALAAATKLMDPTGTHLAVYQYQIVSWELSKSIATYLPWVEFVVAIGLWIPKLRLGASALAASLTLMFLGALSSAVVRQIDITCGCFGAMNSGSQLAPRIAQDLVLLSLSCLILKQAAQHFRDTVASALKN